MTTRRTPLMTVTTNGYKSSPKETSDGTKGVQTFTTKVTELEDHFKRTRKKSHRRRDSKREWCKKTFKK